uniref:R13L1/DRL21-like LRR repeat region domain-containing protein n=1 Tax=Fagus sylvatica TaxID=28930 RepID=A0A2N9GQA6_FAGSY
MAEGVLFDLAGKVLEVAGSFALQEIKLASGVKAELENLKSNNDLLDDFSTEALQRKVMTGNKMNKGEGFNAARSSCGWCKTKKATSSGGLSELKELSNLGGSLEIGKLGHGKDDMVECKATNMKEKQHLQRLEIRVGSRWDGETECYDEESLEGLQPHPNLKALELWYYMGCPILGQRCQRQTGEDWPNIAHVPYVEVDYKNQQQETIPSSS